MITSGMTTDLKPLTGLGVAKNTNKLLFTKHQKHMKKILLFASALAGLFLAGSCQRESLEPEAVGVTYTINLPEGVQTKGNSGYTEYDLYYEVYKTVDADELKTAKILFENIVQMTGNTATLTLDLLNDQNYTILFWANKKEESYFNLADLRNVEMVQAASNNNDRDAFCGVDQIAQHDGAKSKTVTLTRPFAQLNIATIVSTTAGYDLTPLNSYVKVSKIPVAYNVATASPVGEDAVVEYTKNTVPAGKKVNDKYDLVAMNYVLVPEGNIVVYYEIETENGTVKNTVPNVPVKANYRTNIIGNLLTSSATYSVELKPGFEGDTESATTEVICDGLIRNINGDYEVTTATGLAYAVNNLFVGANGVASTAAFYIKPGLYDMAQQALNDITITSGTLNLYAAEAVVTRSAPMGVTIRGLKKALVNKVEDGATVYISGITIEEFAGEDGAAALVQLNNGKVILEDCAIIDENGGIDTQTELVGGKAPVYYVAQVGDTKYESLQDALDAVEEGNTITILKDLSDVKCLYSRTVGFTLDLNGKTLTSSDHTHMLEFNWNKVAEATPVTITITGGTLVSGENTMWTIYSEDTDNVQGTFNLTNLAIDHNMPGYGAVVAGIGNTFNAENVNVTTSYGIGFYAAGGTVAMTNCSADVQGLYVKPYNSMAFAVCANGIMTINSGTYRAEPVEESDANNQGISHGSWCGGVMNSGGTLIINGGTFANGNIGEDFSAANARGAILADKGAMIEIYGGTFNALKNTFDIQDNNAKVLVSQGSFSSDPCTHEVISLPQDKAASLGTDGRWTIVDAIAKVGNKNYGTIDEAIAKWTNNTTLKLLADVTLSDVVTIKSTEHHILDLDKYTLTAASGKNAFEIKACGTGAGERNAITIKADASEPGGINAANKSIVYYKYADGGISTEDRPIITIAGGVFTASTAVWGTAGIYTIGTAARKCATLIISGGEFKCTINGSGKSKMIISGGLFHYSVGSQGDQTAYRLISGGTFKTLGFMTADSNNTKFWFGTSMANSNVGLYINDDNYLVVGGPVITDFGTQFKAKATNATKWSSYLQYSSAAANGLYYTNADMAIKKHGEANVVLP